MLEVKVNGNATIKTDTRNTYFESTKIRVGELRVFKDKSKKVVSILEEEKDVILKIAERYNAKAIIACNNQFFRYLVNSTKDYEIDIELFISKQRKIVHYTTFGIDPAVIIIALAE